VKSPDLYRAMSALLLAGALLFTIQCGSSNHTEENRETDMTSAEHTLQAALDRCRQGTPRAIEGLLTDVAHTDYLDRLDEARVYDQRRFPPNLETVLSCLAASTALPEVGTRLVALSQRREYATSDRSGSLRRGSLIRALGSVGGAGGEVVTFLDRSLLEDEGRYEASAVGSLAKIATPESLAVLRRRVFDPTTSILEPGVREIYLRNYTVELGRYRNRPPVMALLLELFDGELELTVTECLVEDVVSLGADPDFQFEMAPLTSEVPEAPELARQLAALFIEKSVLLTLCGHAEALAGRITSLLGEERSTPPSEQPEGVRAWAVGVFESAVRAAPDEGTREARRVGLSGL